MMIKADHKRWAGWLFFPYLERIFRKDFTNFFISNGMPRIPDDSGLIITPNHISWWDGFFIEYLMRHTTGRRIYLMMLKEQLARYGFFRFLGAYSIDPGNRKEVTESLRYTAEAADRCDAFVVMYPQGEIIPQRSAPLEFKSGLPAVLRLTKGTVSVMPVIFLVKPYNERHPELWCRFGPAISKEKVLKDYKSYEDLCNRQVEELERSILNRDYRTDLFSRISIFPKDLEAAEERNGE